MYILRLKRRATITVNVTSPKGDLLGEKIFETKVFNSKQVDYFRYDISKIDYWDEFNPNLYIQQLNMNVTVIPI